MAQILNATLRIALYLVFWYFIAVINWEQLFKSKLDKRNPSRDANNLI